MNNYNFKFAISLEKLPQCADIRKKVFIDEQKFENEFDAIDKTALHILVLDKELPIATARAFTDGDINEYHLGRICVLKEYRGKNIGKILVEALENHLKEKGVKLLKLSAQVRVKGFYEKLGFTSIGEEYLDEYCPHIDMVKNL